MIAKPKVLPEFDFTTTLSLYVAAQMFDSYFMTDSKLHGQVALLLLGSSKFLNLAKEGMNIPNVVRDKKVYRKFVESVAKKMMAKNILGIPKPDPLLYLEDDSRLMMNFIENYVDWRVDT